ncbi:MAG: hypothetical protein ACPG21_00260 [Crocinitomicaceae bacterium]
MINSKLTLFILVSVFMTACEKSFIAQDILYNEVKGHWKCVYMDKIGGDQCYGDYHNRYELEYDRELYFQINHRYQLYEYGELESKIKFEFNGSGTPDDLSFSTQPKDSHLSYQFTLKNDTLTQIGKSEYMGKNICP